MAYLIPFFLRFVEENLLLLYLVKNAIVEGFFSWRQSSHISSENESSVNWTNMAASHVSDQTLLLNLPLLKWVSLFFS